MLGPIIQSFSGRGSHHPADTQEDKIAQDDRGWNQPRESLKLAFAIPLLYRSELLGILNVESEQVSAYAENDEELLGTLGGSLAAIIANAKLLEQIRSQVDRERVLFEITDKIRRTTDMETILSTTVSELTRAVGANSARIKVGVNTPAKDQKKRAPHD